MKKLPLYKQGVNSFCQINKSKNEMNLGLYYQKFCNSWTNGMKLDKQSFLTDIIKKCDGTNSAILEEQINRLYNLIRAIGGKFKIYSLTERFVTGLGLDHPLEVGFLWNHALGVPYIAGSSIKGLVRSWAENWVQNDSELSKVIKNVFGSDKNTEESQVGSVIFFDALPYRKIRLSKDIITPHYTPYYLENECPGDWYNPTPIPFLTIPKEQNFIFFVAPRTKNDINDCCKALEWLDEVLTTIGAGAKTATGYGCFKPEKNREKAYDERMKEEIEKEENIGRLSKMSPIRREMEKDAYSTSADIFMENLTVKWKKRLEDEAEEEETKKEIARHLANWYQTNRPNQWDKPKDKNIEKVSIIKRFLDDGL